MFQGKSQACMAGKKGLVGIAKVQKLFRTTKEVMEPYEYPCPEDKMYIKETFQQIILSDMI